MTIPGGLNIINDPRYNPNIPAYTPEARDWRERAAIHHDFDDQLVQEFLNQGWTQDAARKQISRLNQTYLPQYYRNGMNGWQNTPIIK